jgi:nitroreductase/NAD-dependent dihydropyrimidine dehydrogenase PreA subunit
MTIHPDLTVFIRVSCRFLSEGGYDDRVPSGRISLPAPVTAFLFSDHTNSSHEFMTVITIDHDLCTRCGICAEVCPAGIISAPGDDMVPTVRNQAEPFCIRCGHCTISCPERALSVSFRQDEELPVPAGFPPEPELIAYYLKNRRSVRHYGKKQVSRRTIAAILDVARYAPSGGNQQPVRWLVIYDPEEVHHLAGLTMDWVRHMADQENPMLPRMMTDRLIASWEEGKDPICRGAPHLLVASVREGPGSAATDGIIAVTYADACAPAFGVGTCWAGFLSMAAHTWPPVAKALALPGGDVFSAALMAGYPLYKTFGIPPRNPLKVTWR